jgi:hypothetical protein
LIITLFLRKSLKIVIIPSTHKNGATINREQSVYHAIKTNETEYLWIRRQ